MISVSSPKSAIGALAIAAALALGSIAEAEVQFQVNLDTSSLIGNPDGPYSLDFQLNDGSAIGDGNNFASISGFKFGGGSATGTPTTNGSAWGDLGSTVSLQDSNPLLNELYQGFTPGSWLSFTVSLSTNLESGPTPDEFTFAILDNSFLNLPTQSLGTDAFVQVDIDSAFPTVTAFGSADQIIGAPSITPVPEASTYGVFGAALLGLIAWKRRKAK